MPTGHKAEGMDALGGTHMPAKQNTMHWQNQRQACDYASYLCYPMFVCGMHIGGQNNDILCQVEPLFFPSLTTCCMCRMTKLSLFHKKQVLENLV